MVVGLLIGFLVLAALAAAAVFLPRLIRGELGALREQTASELSARNAEVDRRLAGLEQTLSTRLTELDQRVDTRLAASATTANQMSQQLGEAAEATKTMIARAQDLARLEQALRPAEGTRRLRRAAAREPAPRPPAADAYELQYTFPSGERVDAVVRAADRLLPIDAKFPLDNFERVVSAENDEERQLHEKAFARDVKGHIDAISAKYIRPDFGHVRPRVHVPAGRGDPLRARLRQDRALLQYAHERRVFPVSATTFSAYLQMIVLGLKGLQIEQPAHEVMAYSRGSQRLRPVQATTSTSSASTSATRRASTPRPRSGSTASRRSSTAAASRRSSTPSRLARSTPRRATGNANPAQIV